MTTPDRSPQQLALGARLAEERNRVGLSQYDPATVNPLDASEASVTEFFRVLNECPVVRETFEIMISRCENVDEFATIEEEVGRPAWEFLDTIERLYRQAAEKGLLRTGIAPEDAARDTWAFQPAACCT